MTNLFTAMGSILAFAGVLSRSLSAHALLQLLEDRGKLDNFNLAADYLLFHGLALIGVGILCHAKIGDHLAAGKKLFTIHANDQAKLETARARLLAAVRWSDEPVERPAHTLKIIE